MLALEIPFSAIKKLFETRAHVIFNKVSLVNRIACATYSNTGLLTVFREVVQTYYPNRVPDDLTFSDILVSDCAVTTYDLSTNEVCWLSKRTTPDLLLIDAALSTSAAPTYFPVKNFDCLYKGNQRHLNCVDGGIWANDPRLFGLFYRRIRNGQDRDRIYNILSFGTGKLELKWDTSHWESTLSWLTQNPSIIDVIFSASTAMTDFMFLQMLRTGLIKSVKLQVILDKDIPLDAVDSQNDQKNWWMPWMVKNSMKLLFSPCKWE